MLDIIYTRFVGVPDCVMGQADDGQIHPTGHLQDGILAGIKHKVITARITYLSEPLSLGVLLETKRREMHSITKYFRLGQDAHAADTIEFHFYVRVAVGVAEVRQVWTVRRILGIPLNDHGVFVEGISQRQSGVRFLP